MDRPDPRNGFGGEREGVGYSARKLAVEINRAAAHARHHARFFQRPAAEPPENDGLLGADVLQHPENLHLELFDFLTAKDGPPSAAHARLNLFQRQELDGESRPSRQPGNQK